MFGNVSRGAGVLAALAGGFVGFGQQASAGVVEVVYGIAAQTSTAKSAVPGGISGVTDARFTNFNNKLYRSPTTDAWITVPTTNATPTSADQVLLIGSGLTGAVAAREGVTAIGTNPTTGNPDFLNFSRLDVPRINDAGKWAVGFRLANGGVSDERLVRFNGTGYDVLKAGDPAPGGGSFYGNFNSVNITNDAPGTVSYLAGVGISAAESAFIGSTRVIDMFVDVPTGQSQDPPQVWVDLDTNQFLTDASGSHYIALGLVGVDPSFDRVFVVDGMVKIQEGSVIPGSGFTSPVGPNTSTATTGVWMESNGDWFAFGTNADGQAWVVRNGTVIAKSAAPITPGSTELWESFRAVRGDNRGNYVVNGNTNASTLTDDVLVANGTTVVARESDGVDLNNDGQTNDSLFLHLVQEHMALMNDGNVYFAARLKATATGTAGAGGSNNASLLRVRAFPAPVLCGTADFNGDSDIGTDQDIEAFFRCLAGNCCATCFSGGADFNGDGDIGTDQDIEAFFRVLAGGNC